MPFVMSNKGINYLLANAITGSTDIRALVCSSVGSPTDAQIEDMNFVSDMAGIGLVEVTNGGYTRAQLDLAGVTVAEDDTNNWTKISATAPVVTNVVAGDTWKRILYFVFITNDASSPVLGIDTPASPVVPNGGNITLPALEIRISDTSV